MAKSRRLYYSTIDQPYRQALCHGARIHSRAGTINTAYFGPWPCRWLHPRREFRPKKVRALAIMEAAGVGPASMGGGRGFLGNLG
jgi:hypothetical protein